MLKIDYSRGVLGALLFLILFNSYVTVVWSDEKTNEQMETLTIKGRLVSWSMVEVRYPWLGGNFYQLEEMIRTKILNFFEEIVKGFRDSVQYKDAGAVHLNDFLDYLNGSIKYPTLFYAELFDVNLGPGLETDAKLIWDEYAKRYIMPDAKEASITFVVVNKKQHVNGLPAFMAVFFIKGDKKKGNWNQVVTAVPLGNLGTHIFSMSATASRYEERRFDYPEMLNNIYYHPDILTSVTGEAEDFK